MKCKHGGSRPGAGRKRTADPVVRSHYGVDITHAQAEFLKLLGGGDLSAGLRWLVEAARPMVRRSAPVRLPQPEVRRQTDDAEHVEHDDDDAQ